MKPVSRERNWDGVAAMIAALIGLLALVVSGYTAYIERQQVRAQVWPYLLMLHNGRDQSLDVLNKGVGPAIVRSVKVLVDGQPQPDWNHALDALGLSHHHPTTSYFGSGAVVSPGETRAVLKLPRKDEWKQLRSVLSRLRMRACFCSALGECWLVDSNNQLGRRAPEQCPTVPEKDRFRD